MTFSRRGLVAGIGLTASAAQAVAQPAGLRDVKHRRINTNGIGMHIAEQGS